MAATQSAPASKVRTKSQSPARNGSKLSSDENGLQEFSVVYTNRALNHMSTKFQKVMRDVSATLKGVYQAEAVALVPGSGTFAMEAVARQFGTGKKCLVLRNGYFSYRWSQIFDMGSIPAEEIVLMAQPVDCSAQPAYAPHSIDKVVDIIRRERPDAVFAPHVETSSGIMLPDEYMKAVAEAVHEIGGLFVLDCIASGCVWVDMADVGVDVLVSAPQKGWSGPASSGIVLLSKRARSRLEDTMSTCFAVDLKKWIGIMEAYEKGGHMYHTTMPTDSIAKLRDVQNEMAEYGFQRARKEQLQLGDAVRQILTSYGFKNVAADGFRAPGVVVSYTDDPAVKSGSKFAALGLQIAAGVPLMVDDFSQSPAFQTFRLGLFGFDKLSRMSETLRQLEKAVATITSPPTSVGTPAARL
eukprot:TRINITY_DN60871_c0_g1_i1.p1 TRINITY_DN60871_c0_g1~~TRINITY_DN60871_c0_g1_i1.p1  ORF type:complete len:412 (-),score=106.06 TRINITY_DN60871_c0_g1_i1:173-1408(-)